MIDLSIWCCCYRDIKSETAQCLEYFRRETTLDYTFDIMSGDSLIGRARSQAASNFLENSESEYILFIDDDIIFSAVDILKIHRNMKEGYEVIGGIYPTRSGKALAQIGLNGSLKVDGSIQEVEYASTGFFGTTKNVLNKIIQTSNLKLLHENDWARKYSFFESGQFNDIYISEDWDFCNKARTAGFKIYVNTSIQLGHIGTYLYTAKDVFKNQCL